MRSFLIPFLVHYGENVSRVFLLLVWALGALAIHRYRHVQSANQALAAALAVVLSHALILLDPGIPRSSMLFFLGCAQATLLISFVRTLRAYQALEARLVPAEDPAC